jgi:hypothetical protein
LQATLQHTPPEQNPLAQALGVQGPNSSPASATGISPPYWYPPATRTEPFSSVVWVWFRRAVIMCVV